MPNLDLREMTIQSHQGPYQVFFETQIKLVGQLPENSFFVVDRRVAELHSDTLDTILKSGRCLLVEALESNKDLQKVPEYIQQLVSLGLKRNHHLVAIGGGIIQDLACFIASCIFRGLDWSLVPTTLLAQADSCIGSKSSINVGTIKNLVGNFYPPKQVFIFSDFLKTLTDAEIRSGIGEMIKVHVIAGLSHFSNFAKDFDQILSSREVLLNYIQRSLEIKKGIIEIDEFDRGPRLVMNYGHTFGHAIESATRYEVPHGIAVTIGMDLANEYSFRLGRISQDQVLLMRKVLRKNAENYLQAQISYDEFSEAISKDKKNKDQFLALILPKREGGVERVFVEKDQAFHSICQSFFAGLRN